MRRVCIVGKAATAGIFLCPLNAKHQREILPTFQKAISLNRTGSSNLAWTTTHSPASLKTAVSSQKVTNCGGLCDFRLVSDLERGARAFFDPASLPAKILIPGF